ncbi:MAG: radical SAM protein [Sphaerochaetaceae bacterium]|nr:radical SAM protein [Sphaerochaetaceae bacterium]
MIAEYGACRLCPNLCEVDRSRSKGFCGCSDVCTIAFSGLHRGEEPPLCGAKGSGMVFFTGCPLRCQTCQNMQISRPGFNAAPSYDEDQLSQLFIDLQEQGAATLNLVTGTQFIPTIRLALVKAKAMGLKLPVVWNSSGYDSIEAIKTIDSLIDLYLLDVKTIDRDVAKAFCRTERYVDVIKPLMDYLTSASPRTVVRPGRIKGILVRHLVFPGTTDASLRFLKWFAEQGYKDSCYLSLMVQFVSPDPSKSYPDISKADYERLSDALEALGIDNGFVQEYGDPSTRDERLWLPDFYRENPFAPGFADILPSFKARRSSL